MERDLAACLKEIAEWFCNLIQNNLNEYECVMSTDNDQRDSILPDDPSEQNHIIQTATGLIRSCKSTLNDCMQRLMESDRPSSETMDYVINRLSELESTIQTEIGVLIPTDIGNELLDNVQAFLEQALAANTPQLDSIELSSGTARLYDCQNEWCTFKTIDAADFLNHKCEDYAEGWKRDSSKIRRTSPPKTDAVQDTLHSHPEFIDPECDTYVVRPDPNQPVLDRGAEYAWNLRPASPQRRNDISIPGITPLPSPDPGTYYSPEVLTIDSVYLTDINRPYPPVPGNLVRPPGVRRHRLARRQSQQFTDDSTDQFWSRRRNMDLRPLSNFVPVTQDSNGMPPVSTVSGETKVTPVSASQATTSRKSSPEGASAPSPEGPWWSAYLRPCSPYNPRQRSPERDFVPRQPEPIRSWWIDPFSSPQVPEPSSESVSVPWQRTQQSPDYSTSPFRVPRSPNCPICNKPHRFCLC